MVQRKVPNKLEIQADDFQSKKLLVNLNTSSQNHDGKNRGAAGAELKKKKMKKSRSTKLIESLQSPSFKRQVPQPGKPPPPRPPLEAPTTTATPQKQSPTKSSDMTPNYMKSTSCFDARKERSPGSSRNSPTGYDRKSPRRKNSNSNNSKNSSASGHKTSSLKLVRTLTKTPSFKPARSTAKKCSPVVLCENLDVQRATCSSTLKDSNFPDYLKLNHGGTESEGTSVMKVCPYTYCSLNGHYHTPLPPLKCFLSARRRVMKTQKSIKLGCLSPRESRASGERMKEIDPWQGIFDEKPAIEEKDFNVSVISPLIQEENEDFFVEIYGKEREDNNEDGHTINGFFVDGVRGSGEGFDERGSENDDGMVVESFSDESACSESDFDDNLEASDMEWEAGEYSVSCVDGEVDNPIQSNDASDWGKGDSLEVRNLTFHDEPTLKLDDIVRSCLGEILADEIHQEFFEEESKCSEALFVDREFESDHDEVSLPDVAFEEPKTRGERNGISVMDLQLGDDKTEWIIATEDEALIDHDENESIQDDDTTAFLGHQEPNHSRDFSEPDQNETNEKNSASQNNIEVHHADDDDNNKNRFSEEVFVRNLPPKSEDSETDQNCLEQEFIFIHAEGGMEEKEQVDSAKCSVGVQSDSSPGSFEAVQDSTSEDNDERRLHVIPKDGESIQSNADECVPAESQDHSSDKQSPTNYLVGNQNHLEKDRVEAGNFKTSKTMDSEDQTHSGMTTLGSSQNRDQDVDQIEMKHYIKPDEEETLSVFVAHNTSCTETKKAQFHPRNNPNKLPEPCKNSRGIARGKRPIKDSEEQREFNPREPNYLPLEPDPEAEKVDLRHQMMDERKNAEEWMLDYALRRAVTNLIPARKRKVALLVEAFETVIPAPKYESHLRHTSAGFAHGRTIQACS
ncbi:unnamed protein product [Ilex paraguariensis]|uniref:Calmodulin-binding domain-containing protein n=1 Tax=Ilex paraguariensis TaxID=185542 RepID=A0ABC8U1V5_9AQUA